MLSLLLRIVGLLTAAGGLWNLVSVVWNYRVAASEFAALAEVGSAFGVLMSWMTVVAGLTLFGVGQVLAQLRTVDPKRIYAEPAS
jgi:hypothetical protein